MCMLIFFLSMLVGIVGPFIHINAEEQASKVYVHWIFGSIYGHAPCSIFTIRTCESSPV